MNTKKRLLACALSLTLLSGMLPTAEISAAKNASLSTKKLTVTKGESKTLKVRNAKKKVAWKILSGKKCITLKKKGSMAATVKGKKKGKVKVQAKTGSQKLTCTITVKDAKGNEKAEQTTIPATATGQTIPSTGIQPVVTMPPMITQVPPAATEQPPAITKQPTETQTPPADTKQPTETQTPPADTDQPPETQAPPADTDQPPETQAPPANTEQPDSPSDLHDQDVAALKKLIAEQQGRGATMSDDINGEQYWWENDRLVEIKWEDCNLTGEISFAPFTALRNLRCRFNKLTSLDASKSTVLEWLDCTSNQLTKLDVSNNPALEALYCRNNQLTDLDVSNNTALTALTCENNQLTALDVSRNTTLVELWCDENQLTELDLTNNTQ